MDRLSNGHMPRARQEKLLVHELADEVLVYDLRTHKAHSLNKTAALVWRRCDGETSVADITRILGGELETDVDENVVWLALKQLDNAHLLGQVPTNIGNSDVSRREVIRRLGWSAAAAAALPLVTSILAPRAQAQASCKPAGQTCGSKPECCPGLNCIGPPPNHCG